MIIDCVGCSPTPTENCPRCDGGGKIRAQLVLTAINLDTGAIASLPIVPGSVEPTRFRQSQSWCLNLRPLIEDLATQTGGVCTDFSLAHDVVLPEAYTPDLPEPLRFRFEARALTSGSYGRHRLFTVRTGHSATEPDPDEKLATLCRLGQLLRTDVVVWRYPHSPERAAGWWIGIQPAGMRLPTGRAYGAPTLDAVLKQAEPQQLLARLQTGAPAADLRTAPARFLTDPGEETGATAETVGSVAELARELDERCGESGAVSIWREGGWHHSPITPEGTHADPPPPSYWGTEIPSRPCPDCEVRKPRSACFECGDFGEQFEGTVITVTDLDTYARHFNHAPDPDAHIVRAGRQPRNLARGRWRLPERYRLTTQFFDDGIDLANTVGLTGSPVSNGLLNGTVVADLDATPIEITTEWCVNGSRGNVAARNFVLAEAPRRDKLSTLLHIASALGLDVLVACRFASIRRAGGVAANAGSRWGVTILGPEEAINRPNVLAGLERYLPAAVGSRLELLRAWYLNHRQPGPADDCPVPGRAAAVGSDADRLEGLLARLATETEFDTISVRVAAARCTVTRHVYRVPREPETEPETDVVLAQAPTIDRVLALFDR